jgi:hypothetical protein
VGINTFPGLVTFSARDWASGLSWGTSAGSESSFPDWDTGDAGLGAGSAGGATGGESIGSVTGYCGGDPALETTHTEDSWGLGLTEETSSATGGDGSGWVCTGASSQTSGDLQLRRIVSVELLRFFSASYYAQQQ